MHGHAANAPIFLIGLPCSGKTTLGEALSRAAEVDFIDLDLAVEQAAGRPVAEIFASDGEEAFRRLERQTLADIATDAAAGRRRVIACGGGTPCVEGVMDMMLAAGIVVWLQASDDRMLARLTEGRDRRPLIASLPASRLPDYLEETARRRAPYYRRATDTFDSSRLDTPAEVDATTSLFIKRYKLTPAVSDCHHNG